MRRVRLDQRGILRPMNPLSGLGSAWAPSVPRWVDPNYSPPAAPPPAPVPAPAPVYVEPAPVPASAPVPVAAPVYVEPPGAPAPLPYYAPAPIVAPPAPVPAPAPAGPYCECVADPTAPGYVSQAAASALETATPADDVGGGSGGEIYTTAAPVAGESKSLLPFALLIAAALLS